MMILCIGEILADMLGVRRDGVFVYERNAGGAPFNVACAVKRFGGSSAFVGNVGDDTVGKYLYDFADRQNLDACRITVDKRHNTTLAFVELDASGERSFCFYRKNTADYYLPKVPIALLRNAGIVCVGSLMLSEDHGFTYAKNVIKQANSLGKLIAFDVNYRTDIFRGKEEAAARYKEIMEETDILKLSEDEVAVFTEDYVASLKDKLVLISRGGAGSRWRYNGESRDVATVAVKPVDTTGAGDAFYAGVLTKLAQKNKGEWTREYLDGALRFGNVCGALNTLGSGAIAHLPALADIEKYL
jgi:fructokinase